MEPELILDAFSDELGRHRGAARLLELGPVAKLQHRVRAAVFSRPKPGPRN